MYCAANDGSQQCGRRPFAVAGIETASGNQTKPHGVEVAGADCSMQGCIWSFTAGSRGEGTVDRSCLPPNDGSALPNAASDTPGLYEAVLQLLQHWSCLRECRPGRKRQSSSQ